MVILTRIEAGRRLAMGLMPAVKGTNVVVVALSPGGVRVAAEIARLYEAPLDIITANRLEVPGRARSVFGAVAAEATLLLPDRVAALGLPDDYVAAMVERCRRQVEEEAGAWRGGAPPVDLAGRVVVLADDGLSEPVLIAAAVQALRTAGAAQVIFAAPNAGPELCQALTDLVDARVLLYEPDTMPAACVRDANFVQTTRLDVRNMVRRSRPELPVVTGP